MDDFVPRFARPEDRPALSRLWLACFPGDTMETVRAVFGRLALETECLVAAPDGFPVSMLLLLPQRYAAAGRSLPVQYIYAAATLPAYRGRGYCGALLKAAFEVGRSRGQAASFLRPASQGLTDYYTQFGYRPFFGVLERRKPLSKASVRVPGLELFPVRDYGAARERVLADGPPHIVWEKRWADLALEQAEAAGGGGFSFAGSAGCALCEPDGDALFVRELLCPASQTDACMSALLSRFGRTGIVCRTPVRAAEGEGTVFGLWRPLDDDGWEQLRPAAGDKPYMGLALD